MNLVCLFIFISLSNKTLQQPQACPVSNCLRCTDGQCTLCQPGHYGQNCSKQCPVNCDLLCLSGYCYKGCNRGWYGLKCENPCPGDCDVCEQTGGKCPTTQALPTECPEGCYCVFGHCSQCKQGYYMNGDRCNVEEGTGETTNSNYATLKSALVGIGLLLGTVVLISCVIFVFCRKYKKSRRASVSNIQQRQRERPNTINEAAIDEELNEMGDNSSLRGQLPLPPYFVSYAPPSYDSLFVTVNPDTDKPPPYESIDQL